MQYMHQFVDGTTFHFPLGKVVCVGRNYAEHAKELNNPVPSSPILFIKPATAVVPLAGEIDFPKDQGSCHFETELALLIGAELKNATAEQAVAAIAGYGLALDLTLRDVQQQLKDKGHPWEIAKSFDGACPISTFVRPDQVNLDKLTFELEVDGQLRQRGDTADMITPIIPLLQFMSRHFRLQPGDVVLTGTPAGVGPLQAGMNLSASLMDVGHWHARVL